MRWASRRSGWNRYRIAADRVQALDRRSHQLPRKVRARIGSRYHRPLHGLLGDRYFQLFPDTHRGWVGGMWEEMGRLQLNFLRERGLEPHHDFLDVGCGALRAGIHFIRYLEPDRYCGLDLSAWMLAAGRVEADRAGLAAEHFRLHVTDEFDASVFGRSFDFALAQSVFTHVSINSVLVCLRQVERVLRPGGRFFATFFHSPAGTRACLQDGRPERLVWPRPDGPPAITYPDRDPFHYGYDVFEWLCEGSDLEPELFGVWGSPRGQSMLVFTKREATRSS